MNLRAIFVAATCAIAITSAPALAQQGKAPIRQKPATAKPAPEKPDMLPTQVLLDRAGYSPGEIDGAGGRNTENAIAAFERDKKTKIADALAAGGSEPQGELDETITARCIPVLIAASRSFVVPSRLIS